ncbi:MAG: dTDP-glucose 4,6-dehydratase [Alphaproteobacteria bacterium BRH_c36]|nr:MAG: dTDP-glucose 4,6-dehydratase [Alphaproteobacteria bacterium BRH_c36]
MAKADQPRSLQFEDAEDVHSNDSANPTFADILAERFSRRDLMGGMLATTAMAAVASPAALLTGCADDASSMPNFNFPEVAAGANEAHYVAEGYNAQILIRWGDKVVDGAPAFDAAKLSADAQAMQFGYNNDFLGFIPIGGRADHGLLVVNHEYTNEELMFADADSKAKSGKRFAEMTPERIAVEMMAHGGSVIEIKREGESWKVVADSKYSRRITALTEMEITGPAAGHDKMKTSADPGGRKVLGMINNCSGATTPWGTWLSCEENFTGYFWNKKASDNSPHAVALQRYGAPAEWYGWGKFHERFDIAKEPNEINRFGWVVEIDPFDPASMPKKRTALGRFKHEGAGNVVNKDGRFVIYQGDDQAFDYIYRFVTRGKVDEARREGNKDLLDEGTLYVARFDADGSGVWLPLVFGTGPLSHASGFTDQGDVLIHTRIAADLLGATKMDRPEDIEVNGKTGKVYCMLSKNTGRSALSADAANPRADNAFGHIIELIPDGGDHAGPTFRWEILVKCGDPSSGNIGATFNPATSSNGWFANPDNCVVDAEGRLWVATDGNSIDSTGRADGLWGLETDGKARGTGRLFFRCPVGAEMCGPCITPDSRTVFVAVQHPGQSTGGRVSTFESPSTRWPDFDPSTPPRPSVVVITRTGGGKIGV